MKAKQKGNGNGTPARAGAIREFVGFAGGSSADEPITWPSGDSEPGPRWWRQLDGCAPEQEFTLEAAEKFVDRFCVSARYGYGWRIKFRRQSGDLAKRVCVPGSARRPSWREVLRRRAGRSTDARPLS